ncbi:interferon-induced transmembrane protein 1-like [Pleurodeles waltl]|uniref:interferon-induced transmembrane protein 1-like n=1 Tax=Pleurodeles waltl TaxID=8319 RepID=UPI0037096B6A
MDSGDLQMTNSGDYSYTISTYESVKEEMEVGVFPRRPHQPAVTSTIVNVNTYQPPPRDHLIWSLFSAIYMNFCCLGFMALVFSVKARDRKLVGDMDGAISYGCTAKSLNITALVLSLFTLVLIILLAATGAMAMAGVNHQQGQQSDIWGSIPGDNEADSGHFSTTAQ